MDVQIRKKVLLTGAGFTHNFGTPLADGMWAEIFNQPRVQATPGVRDKLAGDFDFEGVYNAILNGNSTPEAKQVIKEAVLAAYAKLDRKLVEHIRSTNANRTDGPTYLPIYSDLIVRFAMRSGRGFFFTLNQDLFVERYFMSNDHKPASPLTRPGVEENPSWIGARRGSSISPLRDEEFIQLPSPERFAAEKEQFLPKEGFFYIKLHGSQDWLSFNGERQMVLGRGKEDQIEQEPLLKSYLEVFSEVLTVGERDLLVIGYGFGDEHINRIIAKAVTDHGLKLYVLSPQSPRDLRRNLRQPILGQLPGSWPNDHWKDYMGEIWSGLAGYFPHRLPDLLPGRTRTRDWETVLEHFFGEVA